MLRIPGVILLALCVVAMPSYAAVACGTPCATTPSTTHEHECCPTAATVEVARHAGDADGHPLSHDSQTPGRHHCAAPCCGFVAHVLTAPLPPAAERPLAKLLPAHAAARGPVAHEAIFHPPRA